MTAALDGTESKVQSFAWFRVFRMRIPAAALAVCSLVPSLSAQNLREPGFMAAAQSGFDYIYNLDYDRAEQVMVRLQKDNPEHPAPLLYLCIIDWLRELFRRQELNLDLFMSPSFFTGSTGAEMPPGKREQFFAHIQSCQNLSQRILAKNPRNLDALYLLGSSYGVLSAFSLTIDRSLRRAFAYGNKAYDFNRQVVRLDAGYYDAYMTTGLYQYIVGRIPWYLKWLATIAGYAGTKEEGIRNLNLAVTRGVYVKTDARIIRMALQVYEGRPKDALPDAEELHRRYPGNFIFQINIAQILERLRRVDQAVAEYLAVVRQGEEGKPNFNLLPLSTFRYTLGNRFFRMGRMDAAEGQFRKAIAYSGTQGRERTLSHLRLGQILDLQGKRAEAIACYEAVLRSMNIDNAQEQARRFLRTPYHG